jgi:type II secretory pathway pseudopilin PulG
MARLTPSGNRQRGFTLLVLLFLIAGFGVAMAALGTLWGALAQREKEAELLFIGDQYRRAIESYYRMTPGKDKRYPPNLQALLRDPRFPATVRHLRRLYPDPFSGLPEWQLMRDPSGGILGLFSAAPGTPYKTAGFPPIYESFEGATEYRGWVFAARVEQAPILTGEPIYD